MIMSEKTTSREDMLKMVATLLGISPEREERLRAGGVLGRVFANTAVLASMAKNDQFDSAIKLWETIRDEVMAKALLNKDEPVLQIVAYVDKFYVGMSALFKDVALKASTILDDMFDQSLPDDFKIDSAKYTGLDDMLQAIVAGIKVGE